MFGGGLFGDLPATSKENSISTTNNTEENSNNNNNDSNNNKNNNKPSSSEDVNKKRPISLVNALGNAGTTMAFMPTALQRRTKKPTSTGASSIHKTDVAAKVQALLAEKRNKITTSTTTTRIATTLESSSNPSPEKQLSSQTSESSSHNKENQQQQQQESEEMRLLHASVTNAYDPLHPNDYLAFKEEKKYAIKRVELEKAARDTLERQRIMRNQIAKERKKIEATGDYNKIAESRMNMMSVGVGVGIGGVGSVVPQEENRGGMGRGRGRGRGRGVSNLPAWLIKKQQEDQQKPQQSSQVIPNENDPTKFQDAPTTTTTPTKALTPFKLLILSNMVAPGETDDELEAEVKEECESTCGPVLSIKVMDADHVQPYVRVFVLFQEYKDANQAEALFQGRSFAGRVITARLVDETTFRP